MTAAPTALRAARVLTPDQVLSPGWVTVAGERIGAVGEGPGPSDAHDLGDVSLAPGFVDLHSHGGGGAAFTEGRDAARTVLAAHRVHGTTAMMASLVTDTVAHLEQQIRSLTSLVEDGELLGIHLEGPWLSPRHRGAHDAGLLRAPAPADVERLVDAGAVRMVTLATELPGGLEAVRHLAARGVVAALGHSDATYAQAQAAVAAGVRVATHLFNAIRPVHHRDPGAALALLDHPETVVELIADGVHVDPAVLAHAARAKPGRFVLVTDAMAAAGCADGEYRLGPLPVRVRGGTARLVDGGAIAGSTLTLDRAVAYMHREAGLPLLDAVNAASLVPADVVGRPDLGRIVPGAAADLVVLDPALAVRGVVHNGRWAVAP